MQVRTAPRAGQLLALDRSESVCCSQSAWRTTRTAPPQRVLMTSTHPHELQLVRTNDSHEDSNPANPANHPATRDIQLSCAPLPTAVSDSMGHDSTPAGWSNQFLKWAISKAPTPGKAAVTTQDADRRSAKATSQRRSRELLVNLTLREIRGQFKRTTLGRAWSFINPIATIGIFAIVFSTIMKIEIPDSQNTTTHFFVWFLAAALLPWNYIANGIQTGMFSLVSNAGLLSKVYFPRWIPVAATIFSLTVTFLTELSVLTVIMCFVSGPKILMYIPYMIGIVILATAFVLGLGLVLSIANVYFRDTQHLIGLLLQLWFYLTPIIYPFNMVQKHSADLAKRGIDIPLDVLWQLNPAFHVTDAFRRIFYDYAAPTWHNWVGMLFWGATAMAVGVWVFTRHSARIVEEL